MVIYLITNTVNGKVYVGKTQKNPHRRWRSHCKEAEYKSGYLLHRAIRKYGSASFTLQILAHTNTAKQLNDMEKVWICLLNSRAPNGYNATDGGEGIAGWKHSAETRKKLSDLNRGKVLSAETRKKISAIHKGRKFSAERCQQMSIAMLGHAVSWETRQKVGKHDPIRWALGCEKNRISHLGRKRSPESIRKSSEANRGRKNTPETIAKMSAAAKGRIFSPETRAKLSAAHKGIFPTIEARYKMSASQKRRISKGRLYTSKTLI